MPDESDMNPLADGNVEALASVLTATPNLRAKFFAHPTRAIGSNLPPPKYWEYGGTATWWKWLKRYRHRRKVRAHLAQAILLEVAKQIKDKKLSSTVNTDAVFEDFFAPIVRVSQRSFTSVFLLSWAAFAVGLGLIASGVYIAIHHSSSGDSAAVGAVFGGSGAISALGAVFAMAKEGIRDAALDHARLRAVLTAFATQLGQLRAVAERPVEEQLSDPLSLEPIEKINADIAKATKAALEMIPSPSAARAAAASAKTAAAATTSRSPKRAKVAIKKPTGRSKKPSA
jgi:hypothetical protein